MFFQKRATEYRHAPQEVTNGRVNTFAGIRPADAPGFILAQFLGATAATLLFRWLTQVLPDNARAVTIPCENAAFLSESEVRADGPLTGRKVL